MRTLLSILTLAGLCLADTIPKIIYQQSVVSPANVRNKQIGVNANVDADLGWRMWFGKDHLGALTQWLAKDKPARVTSLKTDTLKLTTLDSGYIPRAATGGRLTESQITDNGVSVGVGTASVDTNYKMTVAGGIKSTGTSSINPVATFEHTGIGGDGLYVNTGVNDPLDFWIQKWSCGEVEKAKINGLGDFSAKTGTFSSYDPGDVPGIHLAGGFAKITGRMIIDTANGSSKYNDANLTIGSNGNIDLFSDSIAHGVTSVLPTNVHGRISDVEDGVSSQAGGIKVKGVGSPGDDLAECVGVLLDGTITSSYTSPDAEIGGAVVANGTMKNGTTVVAIDDSSYLFTVANYNSPKLAVTGDGGINLINSSISHGVTSVLPTNVHGRIGDIYHEPGVYSGGIKITGIGQYGDDDNTPGIILDAMNLTDGSNHPPLYFNSSRISGTGKIAIASGLSILDVANNGTTKFSILGDGSIASSALTSNYLTKATTGGVLTESQFYDNGNWTGVSTTSLQSKFVVAGNSDNSGEDCQLTIRDDDGTAGSKIPTIGFYGGTSKLGIIRWVDGIGLDVRDSLDNVLMRLTNDGKLIINNLTGTEKLNVTGNIKASGKITGDTVKGKVGVFDSCLILPLRYSDCNREGSIWYQENHGSIHSYIDGVVGTVNRTLFVQSNTVLDSNSTVETSLIGTSPNHTLDSFPSRYFTLGKTHHFIMRGKYSTLNANPDTMVIKVKLNTTVLCSARVALDPNETNQSWGIDGYVVCIDTGATGKMSLSTGFSHTIAGVQHFDAIETPDAGTTVNTTLKLKPDITFRFTKASASNKIKSRNFIIEELH